MPLAAVNLLDLADELILLTVGMIAGLLGGLLGIGGGVVMIPAMVIFLGNRYGPNSFHVFKLAAISTSLVLSLPAVIRHLRARAVVLPALPGLLPLAVVGVIIGVLLAGTFVGQHAAILRRMFGGFLELVVLSNLYQEWRSAHGDPYIYDACPVATRRTVWGLVVALPAGFIAGMLGIGGGVWAVPAQRQLLGVQIRSAIANSAFMIICISIATSIALTIQIGRMPDAATTPGQGWWLALWLAPGAAIGGWFGGGLTHKLPVRWLRYGFLALLAITGWRLMRG